MESERRFQLCISHRDPPDLNQEPRVLLCIGFKGKQLAVGILAIIDQRLQEQCFLPVSTLPPRHYVVREEQQEEIESR